MKIFNKLPSKTTIRYWNLKKLNQKEMTTSLISSKIYIFHQNMQSIKNKIIELDLIVETFPEKQYIICITEHWLLFARLISNSWWLLYIYKWKCRFWRDNIQKNKALNLLLKYQQLNYKKIKHSSYLFIDLP